MPCPSRVWETIGAHAMRALRNAPRTDPPEAWWMLLRLRHRSRCQARQSGPALVQTRRKMALVQTRNRPWCKPGKKSPLLERPDGSLSSMGSAPRRRSLPPIITFLFWFFSAAAGWETRARAACKRKEAVASDSGGFPTSQLIFCHQVSRSRCLSRSIFSSHLVSESRNTHTYMNDSYSRHPSRVASSAQCIAIEEQNDSKLKRPHY